MIEPFALESIVGNWLWTTAKDLLVRKRLENWPDFELRDKDGTLHLLELKAKPPGPEVLRGFAMKLALRADSEAHFLLVTPEPPDESQLSQFTRILRPAKTPSRWIALQELPDLLGRPSPGEWDSPRTWASLQTSALVKGLATYSSAPIGVTPYESSAPTSELESLARQFSYRTLSRLSTAPGPLTSKLGFGERREDVTVVLSDIVNFSSFVTASRPDDLKEAMSAYYQRSRQAVFDHGGMLDKFIGDAVLAVFGYPDSSSSATLDAIRFARSLIEIGGQVMAAWQLELNAVIATGTRIGIASGDIWPINIGTSSVEITLLGDTINLAARLEKNCPHDRLLIDNRTHTAAMRADASFVSGLALQSVVISPSDAKGQAFPIRAWTLP